MSYKVVKRKNGVGYLLNGRFVSKASIPPDILIKLNVGMEVDEKPVVAEPKQCIFCGMATKIVRNLNHQAIAVCEEHYYSKNVGQTVQQWNKVNGVKQDEKVNV